ncbi:MAG: CDP-alcohol phosphatidyltransferase family protein [Clostridiales bacterium]|nr:CDP-alcohol phosphatidyltransferase family protein [Clostridiales bacterium]
MIANTITVFRIAASFVLLFCPVFSPAFFALYIAAGVSDMTDGLVARKTNTVSGSGAKLDTAADFVFTAVCLFRLLPIMDFPEWLYVWIGIIALIKAVNIISGFAVHKKYVAVHSAMNKAAGAMLFLFPLTVPFIRSNCFTIMVCAAATFAAAQEGHLIRTSKEME